MRPFRFGVQASGPADRTGWQELARKVEGLGYSTLSVADHFDNRMAPMPALCMAAAATESLIVGSIVLANDFRHPAVVAHEAATLDLLSDGRFQLGIGAGWQTTDYAQTGIELDPASVRIARLGEAVEIIKQCFTAQPFSFESDHYTIDGLTGSPGFSDGHPPILMGGGGPKMLRTAAVHADIVGINPNLAAGVIDHRAGPDATLERTREKVGWVREAAGDRFADIELQVRIHLASLTDDPAGFAEQMGPPLGLTPEQATASPHALAGSVSEIADKLRGLREELGLSYFTWNASDAEALAPIVAELA